MGSVISQLHLSNVTLLLLGVLLAGNDVTDAEAVTSSQSNTSSSPSCSCIGSIITSVVATCVGTALICIITAFLLHRHHIRKTNSARDLIVQGQVQSQGQGQGLENGMYGQDEDEDAAAAATVDTITLSRHHHSDKQQQISDRISSTSSDHVTISSQSLNGQRDDHFHLHQHEKRRWSSLSRHPSRTSSVRLAVDNCHIQHTNNEYINAEFIQQHTSQTTERSHNSQHLRKWPGLAEKLEKTAAENIDSNIQSGFTHSHFAGDTHVETEHDIVKSEEPQPISVRLSGNDVILRPDCDVIEIPATSATLAADVGCSYTASVSMATTAELHKALTETLLEEERAATVPYDDLDIDSSKSAGSVNDGDEERDCDKDHAAARLQRQEPEVPVLGDEDMLSPASLKTTQQHPLTMVTLGDYFISANPSLIEEMVEKGDVVSLINLPYHTDFDPDLGVIDLSIGRNRRRSSLGEFSSARHWRVDSSRLVPASEVNNNDVTSASGLVRPRSLNNIHSQTSDNCDLYSFTSGEKVAVQQQTLSAASVGDSLNDVNNDFEIKTILGPTSMPSPPILPT